MFERVKFLLQSHNLWLKIFRIRNYTSCKHTNISHNKCNCIQIHTSSFMKLAKIQVPFEVIIVLYIFVSLVSKCFLVKLYLFYSPALKILSFSIASSVLSIFSISHSLPLSLGSSFPFSHSVLVLTLQSPSRNL